jgi:CarD family transcriptional regulator
MTFEVGTLVVYPSHGIAEIVGREERLVAGEMVACLVMSVDQRGWEHAGGMRVSVPEDRAEDLGVRSVVSAGEAARILEILSVTDLRSPTNWSRRLKNHQEKLKSGDVSQCAEVVRNLAARQRTGSLSNIERSMYGTARYLLIGELAASWGVGSDEAAARVDEVLHGNIGVER